MTNSIRDAINSLVKVANEMVDVATAPQNEKAGPDEVLQALEGIISKLEQVAASIPAESAEKVEAKPEVAAQPDTQKYSKQIEKLEETVKDLNSKLDLKEREEVAENIVSYFEPSKQAKKYDEIMKSKDSLASLKTKLESYKEIAQESNVQRRIAKSESGFSIRLAQSEQDA